MSLDNLPDGFVPPKQPAFATYIQTRTPQWKFHTNIGHAKNAIGSAYCNGNNLADFLLLEIIEGEWVVKHRIKPGTPKEDMPWNQPESPSTTPRADKIAELERRLVFLETKADEIEEETAQVIGQLAELNGYGY